ncbi:hypothetical protein RB595_007815 [Gaeumannomyces hyphopodioides]
MPFIANTPESLLGRTDSKNPATTCRGITSGGRPCRRPLSEDAPAGTAPSTPPRRKHRLRVDDPADESLYCWQHKEQASMSAHSSPGPRLSHTPILEERTSIDTLADRLGLLDVSNKPSRKHRPSHNYSAGYPAERPSHEPRPQPKSEGFSLCCFRIPIDTDEGPPPPTRPKPRPVQSATPAGGPTAATPTKPGKHLSASSPSHGSGSGRKRHSSSASAQSHTAEYMSLILPSTDPQTASQLLAELAKPVSQTDDAGYIYMFWLTPDKGGANAPPPTDAARSLLAPPSSSRQRRPSDVMAPFAAGSGTRSSPGKGGSSGGKKTILLKIGRANNVQRRLNEWSRQCEYNVSLIRYYPYVPSSSPSGSPGAAVPRKMPHSHKVERLVHIELAGMGLRVADREKCSSCGREHREWFEVEASRAGVEVVDEVIRRWATWDESRG